MNEVIEKQVDHLRAVQAKILEAVNLMSDGKYLGQTRDYARIRKTLIKQDQELNDLAIKVVAKKNKHF